MDSLIEQAVAALEEILLSVKPEAQLKLRQVINEALAQVLTIMEVIVSKIVFPIDWSIR